MENGLDQTRLAAFAEHLIQAGGHRPIPKELCAACWPGPAEGRATRRPIFT